MNSDEFERGLTRIATRLQSVAQDRPFGNAQEFERAVRAEAERAFPKSTFAPPGNGQAFPDVAVGEFGIEVKFTESANWRCVANSVLESDRRPGITSVYVMYARMSPAPEIRWRRYEEAVVHVRTSHVPRFEIDMEANGSLFDRVEVPYERFRVMAMHEKMAVIRRYAKQTIAGSGRRLWWIEDEEERPHTLPPEVRLYTALPAAQKLALRAESALVSPKVVGPAGERGKYDDAAMYLLTYHGVMCTQVRDLFSAGSVAMRSDRSRGGIYIDRALRDIEQEIVRAADRVPDSILSEYWGVPAPPRNDRLRTWLALADSYARGWRPSAVLFRDSRDDRVAGR